MIADSVLELIGNTPLVRINKLNQNKKISIFAKLEGQNPGGSVKDRIALSMIKDAEKSKKLTKNKIILESTSGNTGIALAMIAATKGYKVILTMSESMSVERKKMLKAFGAELIETPAELGTGGAIEKAQELFNKNPGKYWMANQHSNLANPLAHYENTAEEIIKHLPDITHFIAGIGTFGTLLGTGKRLREYNSNIKIIGVEPKLGNSIQGIRNMQEKNAPKLYDEKFLDEKIIIDQKEALDFSILLAKKEGLFLGMSAGAAMCASFKYSKTLKYGRIVVIFPDRGEKYLSTGVFD